MAKCSICNKGVMFGKNVSHSNRKSSKKYKPNVQSVKINENGTSQSIKVCARCLKTEKLEKI